VTVKRAPAADLWRHERLGDGPRDAFALGSSPRGVLCLHGFSGTPFEVRPLAETLAGAGYQVEAPVLAGHEAGLDVFGRSTWRDWLGSAHEALARLRGATGHRVGVVGFSMGGLLATLLAAGRPEDVAAVVIMSAPLRLPPFNVGGTRFLSRLPAPLRRGPFARVPKLGGSDLGDPEMKRRNPALSAFPVPAVLSLIELMAEARGALGKVKAPALVVQGRLDHTVARSAAQEIVAGLVGAATVEHLFLERSRHLVALDVERETLAAAVVEFFGRVWPSTKMTPRG